MEKLVKDMTPRLIGETWRKYPTANSKYKYRFGLYECQYCGTHWESQVRSITGGDTKSCGCQKGGKPKHGLTHNKFYNTWNNMMARCYKPNSKAYKDYGARGITICGEWQDVKNFVDWAEKTYPNIEGYTLDRIDNDENYEPSNCRWVNKTTQAINQRRMKNNKSGYVGVVWYIRDKKWYANIRINKILKQIGSFKTLEEAVQARDNYIIENNLPHKLSTEYKKE